MRADFFLLVYVFLSENGVNVYRISKCIFFALHYWMQKVVDDFKEIIRCFEMGLPAGLQWQLALQKMLHLDIGDDDDDAAWTFL